MKSYMRLVAGLAALAVCSSAVRAADPVPSHRAPKEMPKQKKPATLPESPTQGTTEELKSNPLIADPLRGVIIIALAEKQEFRAGGAQPVSGLVVRNIPLFQGKDFAAVVNPYIGRPMRMKDLKQLQKDIVLYCRHKKRPVVNVILPEQNLSNGVLQMLFVEGHVGKVVVENAGEKWFSDNSIKDEVRLKSGDAIDSKKLLEDVNWLNRNPFRQVDVNLRQGEQLGETDLGLHVEDRFPVRFYAGYEDSGTKLTGEERLLAGFNWGNAFGVGHQLNYQYTTDLGLNHIKAHSAAYVMPLPWRHTFSLYGSHVEGVANFPSTFAGFNQEIESWQGSGRYEIPLIPMGKFTHQLSFGFDFKRSNNGLEFGQTSLSSSNTDIGQFEAGYSFSLPDSIGQTKLGLEVFYSPGNLFERNTDADFDLLRTGARSEYMYYRATLERLTKLPCDFSWLVNMSAQGANERLLPSEELGLGGWQTVRGYDERVINGDQGAFASTELRTPPVSLISPLVDWVSEWGDKPKSSDKRAFWRNDQFQFLIFFDAGATRLKKTQPGEIDHQWLASYGAGLRYNINPYLAIRFDYGIQLHDSGASKVSPGLDFTKHSRGHLGAIISF